MVFQTYSHVGKVKPTSTISFPWNYNAEGSPHSMEDARNSTSTIWGMLGQPCEDSVPPCRCLEPQFPVVSLQHDFPLLLPLEPLYLKGNFTAQKDKPFLLHRFIFSNHLYFAPRVEEECCKRHWRSICHTYLLIYSDRSKGWRTVIHKRWHALLLYLPLITRVKKQEDAWSLKLPCP